MTALRFEWDEAKDRENQRKHGVSFAEAQSVFFDENAVEFYDDEHSEWEDRFLLLGLSGRMRILLVCHCLREGGSVIRIISARKATKNEQRLYPRGAP
ncbi:MAG: BrnT family toxin [Verrucomicrobiota bacterium]